jgi:hypothetical protein
MWVRLGRTDAIWLITGLLTCAIPLAALMMRGLDRADGA